jgi:hypothetical protein
VEAHTATRQRVPPTRRSACRSFAADAATGRIVCFPDGEYSPVVTDGIRSYLTGYTALYGVLPR